MFMVTSNEGSCLVPTSKHLNVHTSRIKNKRLELFKEEKTKLSVIAYDWFIIIIIFCYPLGLRVFEVINLVVINQFRWSPKG